MTLVLGSDEQMPALESLLGKESLDLATIGQALRRMDAPARFDALPPLPRPDGGIAEVADRWFTGLVS